MNRSTVTEDRLLVIPLKVTKRYDLQAPLAAWLDPQRLQNCRHDLTRLASIRHCLSSSIGTHAHHKGALDDHALRDCLEYQAALEGAERCGLGVDIPALELEWECALERDGSPMIRSNLRHERVCVLFNVAALQSYVAAKQQDLHTEAGLLQSVKTFNSCAGIFRHLRTTLRDNDDDDRYSSVDLAPSSLATCEHVCLAQAQSAVYDVAQTRDSRPGVLASLAMGAAELFGEALLHLQPVRSRVTPASVWTTRLKCQSATYRALAEFHSSQTRRSQREHGAEIARLRATDQLCGDGIRLAGKGSAETTTLVALQKLVKQRLAEAERDNRELYRDIVPRTLEPIVGRRMAKPTFVPEDYSSASLSRPIFTKLHRTS